MLITIVRILSTNLFLAKGEFIHLDRIINHVAMPESLKEFHEKGKSLINVTLADAADGKPLDNDILM